MNRDSPGPLTERQEQCIRRAGLRLTSKEIARELGIEPGTVDQHIKAGMRALGASTRREAAERLALIQSSDSQADGVERPDETALNQPAGQALGMRDEDPPFRLWPRGDLDWNDLLPWQRSAVIAIAATAGILFLIALTLGARLAMNYGNQLP